MNTVTQTMLYRQALINYANKKGVTKAAIRYKTNRQYIYHRLKRYDGTMQSLANKSDLMHLYHLKVKEHKCSIIMQKLLYINCLLFIHYKFVAVNRRSIGCDM